MPSPSACLPSIAAPLRRLLTGYVSRTQRDLRRTAMIGGMSESSAPPPGARPVGAGGRELSFDLAAGGGLKKLLGGRGRSRLVLTPEEIVIEHGESLRGPLRFAPGAVSVATVDRPR